MSPEYLAGYRAGVEAAAKAVEGMNAAATGREWVPDSLWHNILARGAKVIRDLLRAAP